MDYVLLLLAAFCVGAFSIQSAFASSLANKLKGFFGLVLPFKYKSLTTIKAWKVIVPNKFWFTVTFPFIAVFIISIYLWQTAAQGLNCAYCTSFWLMLVVNITILGLTPIMAVLMAPLALVAVTILERLMS